ncbi:unnamed protein product [Urochloa decumbens]|uniref:Cytochrome P450 n=1 Tax=Urochloa decumbens TaxID=240449 RepID=A0ABC9AN55_9POAL
MDLDLPLLYYAPCVLVLVLSSVYLLGLLADSRRNLPPGPRLPLPLVGNLFSLGALPHRSLARLAEYHGPIMTLRLGTVTTVVASSAAAARDVLHRHDAALSGRSLPDATHVFAHYTHSKVRQLVSHVERVACGGMPIAVRRLTFATAINLLSSTIFSADVANLDDGKGSSESSFQGVLAEVIATVGLPNMSDFFPEIARFDPQGIRRRIKGLFQRLHNMIDDRIELRLRERATTAGNGEPPANKNFLDVLLDYRGTDDGKGFDRQTLLTLLLSGFLQCRDRHKCRNIEWAIAELLLNPKSMARAQSELAQELGSRPEVEESDIDKLKYLQAIVKETFRIHPPAPLLLPHEVEDTTQIQDGRYTVPQGTHIVVNVWAIGRDGEVWPEPEKFMPEGFSKEESGGAAGVDFRGRDFELLPFGSGRRMCPGMPLAHRMVHLMLASLLHRFEWRMRPEDEKNGLDMSERVGLNLAIAKPLQPMATPV